MNDYNIWCKGKEIASKQIFIVKVVWITDCTKRKVFPTIEDSSTHCVCSELQ